MKIAVLFDGAGLARLGLEQAGHECTGFELNPVVHYLGQFVGSGNTMLADVRDVDLSPFDAVWASPPCQPYSVARTEPLPETRYNMALLDWALAIKAPVLWVENVMPQGSLKNAWGRPYNAAQFLEAPVQNRNRLIGGNYLEPKTFRKYARLYDPETICPAITASEYKGCASDTRRASRFYGRKLTVEECAYHQGFTVPSEWNTIPDEFSAARWERVLYEVIGNGVPVYMAKAFGDVYA